MNNVKKHVLSLLLTVALIAGIIYPALQIGAKAINEKVILSATAVDNIAIKKSDKLPETDDYDGVLSLSTGTFEIERDYAQKATVTVTNTGENNIEYYLVVQNIYKDIYMNFVRNGSAASPLVIKPGEKQSVQLDIFAQNAEQEEYYLPIYAMIIKGDSEVEDAKSTITLKCPGINLDLSLNLISEDPYSLAKTYKLYNNGETLTDVTVAVEGEAKDYIAVDPIIENYQLNKRNSVSFNATPDLSKMKENNLTTIDGQLVVSAGGKSRSFDLLFDTQGKEITSISMGALALIQNGNMYANMIVVDGTDNVEATQNNDGFTFKKEIQFAYGDNYSQKLSTTLEIEGKKCAEEAEESSVINYISKGKYVAKSHRTLTQDEYSNEVFIIKTSAIYSSKTILKTIEDYYDENSMYQMDFILTIDDGCSKNIEESEKSLSDLTYYAIGNSASSYLSNPELSKSDRTAYSVAEIFSLLMTCHNSDFEINQEDDTSFDFLDDAIFSKPTVFDNNGLKGYQATITVDEDLSFDFFSDYLVVDDLEEGLNYIESESDGEKVYVADSIVFIIKDGKVFFSFYAFEDNSDGTYNRIRMGMEFASTDDIQTASYSDDIISTQNLVEEIVEPTSVRYFKFYQTLCEIYDILKDKKKDKNKEDYEFAAAQMAIDKAKELVGGGIDNPKMMEIETNFGLAKLSYDAQKAIERVSNEYIEKAAASEADFWGKKTITRSMKKCAEEMGEIAKKVNKNDACKKVFKELQEYFEELSKNSQENEDVCSSIEKKGYQCTNAGQTTTTFKPQNYSSTNAAKTSPKAKTGNEETVKMFVTGRMYAAADVNKFYGNPGSDYVDIAATQYSYTLNGYKVATSFNSGVTDVAIANIPTEHLKFGQSNTLVCDYLTNPGHYFVNTDTQISLIYPADTYISYIGSPETLNDIRSLPDFAIYSENIFGSSDDVVIGSKTEVSFNVYNRGSIGGWFDIEVKCGNNVAYTETNHYLDCFSGDNIVFEWIPEKETEDITVTLTNKSVGLDEKKTDNNSATRTFKARTRVVPSIESITPDYATEGEGIVFATVSNYADVIKAEFYVDDVLYKGEVKYSVVNNQMRCWINDSEMAEGNHIIKVVVTYATGSNSTATIEGSSSILVLNADWNKYEFVLDTSFSSPLFYIYNKKTQSYKQTYDVSRNGENCVLTLTKDMYDNLSDYVLFISCHNGFVHKNLSDKASTFDYESVNTLDFIGNENVCFVGIRYKSFDGNTIDVYGGNNSSVKLTPAKYNIEIEFTCFEESKTANLEIDLTNENKTVDLASLISKYTFKFADEINGTPLAKMFYRNTATENWNSFVLKQSLSENELMCVVSDYNIDAFNNASEAFILVTTNNSVFVADVKPETDPSEVILLDKSKVQKYSLDTGDKDFSYVKVDCERFSVNLYSSTIYIHPGEYDITINFGGENENMEYCLYSQAVDYETADVTIDWSKAYKEKDAYVYAIGESGEKLSLESYEAGTSFEVKKDIYSVKTNITRNNSYYTVDSAVDASDEDCEIYIGSRFEGKITNTFETIDGGSTIRMYLDYLVDDNGNTLSYFNSKNEDDNLKGYVTFTDLSNKLNTYKVYVSLDNVSSFDVKIPDVDGTYSVSLEVMTENEIIRNVGEIELDVSNLSLSLNETYTLVATVYPENATNKNVTWASSNSDIVSVDKNGNITASKFSNGTVYVTATTEDGGYTATCSIEVKLTWWQKILKFILISPLFQYVMELIY